MTICNNLLHLLISMEFFRLLNKSERERRMYERRRKRDRRAARDNGEVVEDSTESSGTGDEWVARVDRRREREEMVQEDEDNMMLEGLNEKRKRQEAVVGEDLEEVVGEDFDDVTMDEMREREMRERERKKRQGVKRTKKKSKKKEAKKMKRKDTDTDSESEIEEAKVIKLNKNDFFH